MRSTEHRRRVARLLRGERRVTDLDRLFADLRSSGSDFPTVREVGDFFAHRDERDKGIALKRAADMQISARAWLLQMNGQIPSLNEAKKIAEANLRIAPDSRIRDAIGMSRQQALTRFRQAVKRLADGRKPKDRQEAAFNWLAGTFVWETAFNDDELMKDFTKALIDTGALEEADREKFYECKAFVALHTLTVMHMSRLRLPDGKFASLRLATRKETDTLRITASIPVADFGKPISCEVSVFETNLDAETYSSLRPAIAAYEREVPIEIGKSGKIEEVA